MIRINLIIFMKDSRKPFEMWHFEFGIWFIFMICWWVCVENDGEAPLRRMCKLHSKVNVKHVHVTSELMCMQAHDRIGFMCWCCVHLYIFLLPFRFMSRFIGVWQLLLFYILYVCRRHSWPTFCYCNIKTGKKATNINTINSNNS